MICYNCLVQKSKMKLFIGPCTAKKNEVLIESIKDTVDYVLTFEELIALFDAFEVNPAACADIVVDETSIFGRNFALGGGLTEYFNTGIVNLYYLLKKC